MITFKTYISEASKVGDLVKITSKDLIYEYEKTSDGDFFLYSFDPQDGAGGWDPFDQTIAAKEASSWVKSNKSTIGSNIDYFLPKSPGLQKLKLNAPPFSNKYKYGVDDNFPVVGKVHPIERYKFIVDEQAYEALPKDTIAASEYDYSFHGGEGIVTSWIMAIGKDQGEVKSKLDTALTKVKVQYVGSEIELKYAQKRAVGR